jgi:2-polyprenyl-3-methyl-5-hydroxy-6-metoxy-1,4-benzoquinol methylase
MLRCRHGALDACWQRGDLVVARSFSMPSQTPKHQSELAFACTEHVEQCNVCGQRRFWLVDRTSNVVECLACGFRWVTPRPSQSEIARAYSHPRFYDGWLRTDAGRHEMWSKRLCLVRASARGSRLLDIGAGIGTFLAMARDEAGWNVTGTEVSRAAIALARQRHGIELLCGQADHLTLPSAQFDTVTLWHVLEHVPSPSRLLRVCHDALAPGGLLVVAVPNDSGSRARLQRMKGAMKQHLGFASEPQQRYYPLTPSSEIHLSHFSGHVLKRLLEQSGFHLQRMTVDDHYPEPTMRTEAIVAAYRLVQRATGHNLGQAILALAERR